MIKLYLTRGNSREKVCMFLPATPGEVGEAWGSLDCISGDVASTRIVKVVSDVWGIEQHFKNADINDSEQFKKMNQIAEVIGSLKNDGCRIFEGALDIEDVRDLDDVINIGGRLDQYILISKATSISELGVFLVQSGIVNFDKSTISDPDYTRIGVEYGLKHHGAYTPGGFVARRNCVEQDLINMVDKDIRQKSCEMKMG